jgi:hypothetical protein
MKRSQEYSLFITRLSGGVRDLCVQLALVLLVGVPLLKPDLEILQARLQDLELAVLAEEANDLHENIVAEGVFDVEQVEDGAQGAGGEGKAVGRRRSDRLEQVTADGGQVLLGLLTLEDEVDEKVVGRGEVLLGDLVEKVGGLDDGLQGVFAVVLVESGLTWSPICRKSAISWASSVKVPSTKSSCGDAMVTVSVSASALSAGFGSRWWVRFLSRSSALEQTCTLAPQSNL